MPELDGIRGLAILGVLCSHGTSLTGIFGGMPTSIACNVFMHLMVPLWGGVDLFFVLSGFLITSILLRTKANESYFSSFYARRMLRIFPVYYFVLILSLAVGRFSTFFAGALPPWTSWRLAYFLYLQNWPVFWHGEKIMGGLWGAYWSLAVEEQFYLVWPLIILLLPSKTVARICYIGFACALPLRIYLCIHYFRSSFGLVQFTSSRVDGLLLGAACAIYMFEHRTPVPIRWIIASAAIGTAIMGSIVLFRPQELVATGGWIMTFGISAFALLSTALVAISQHQIPWVERALTLNWLRIAGKYSYGIYVYHLLLFLPVREYLGSPSGAWIHLNFPEGLLLMLAEVTAVFLIAKLSYDLFESRFLRLKKHFTPELEHSYVHH
jgi:peptidoglycan/LPS O-acetylase OafA/YrhL